MTDPIRQTRSHHDLAGWIRPVEVLFAGHEAGAYELPERLTGARAHLHRVQAALRKYGPHDDPNVAIAELATAAATSATIKGDLGKRVLEIEAAVEEALAQRHVLFAAEAAAAQKVAGTLAAEAEAIVEDCLQPALDTVMAEAGANVPKLDGAITADKVFRADEPAREAWFALEELFDRYRLIRAAYGDAIYRHVFREEIDVNQLDLRTLLAFRNWFELPKARDGVSLAMPSERAPFMAWLVTGEPGGVKPEPWLPLPDDVEEAIGVATEHARAKQQGARARVQSEMTVFKRAEHRKREQRESTQVPGPHSRGPQQ